eukprot:5286438-Prymnesium_polylepis.1
MCESPFCDCWPQLGLSAQDFPVAQHLFLATRTSRSNSANNSEIRYYCNYCRTAQTSYYSKIVAITSYYPGNNSDNKSTFCAQHARAPPRKAAVATPAGALQPRARAARPAPQRRAADEHGLDGADEGGAGVR